MALQGRWIDDSSLLTLPHLGPDEVEVLEEAGLGCLPLLVEALAGTDSSSSSSGSGGDGKGSSSRRAAAEAVLEGLVGAASAKEVVAVCDRMPVVQLGVGKVPRLVRVRRGEQGEGDGEDGGGEGAQGLGAQEEEEWEVELELSRVRQGQGDRRGGRPRVYAPRFPKVRGRGWAWQGVS